MFDHVNAFCRRYLGFGLLPVVAFLVACMITGSMFAVAFPKYSASALLRFPERNLERNLERNPERNPERGSEDKDNAVDLAEYKRTDPTHEPKESLAVYLEATGARNSEAAQLLIQRWEGKDTWSAVPVLPISRREQKEYGEVKEGQSSLLGVEIKSTAPSEPVAVEIVNLLAGYIANAILRERIRSWVVNEKLESMNAQHRAEREIVRAELEIVFDTRRAQEMKAILARYPEAARMDTRQVVTLNESKTGSRFLSPLAQLVGAESAIAAQREAIGRFKRDLLVRSLLSQFYREAEPIVNQHPDVGRLLQELETLGKKIFAQELTGEEWAREASLRVYGALTRFGTSRSQFGIRHGVRVAPSPRREPHRLALFAAVVGLALLGGLAVLRLIVLPPKTSV